MNEKTVLWKSKSFEIEYSFCTAQLYSTVAGLYELRQGWAGQKSNLCGRCGQVLLDIVY